MTTGTMPCGNLGIESVPIDTTDQTPSAAPSFVGIVTQAWLLDVNDQVDWRAKRRRAGLLRLGRGWGLPTQPGQPACADRAGTDRLSCRPLLRHRFSSRRGASPCAPPSRPYAGFERRGITSAVPSAIVVDAVSGIFA